MLRRASSSRLVSVLVLLVAAGLAVLAACTFKQPTTKTMTPIDPGAGGAGGMDVLPGIGGLPVIGPRGNCQNLQCQQSTCKSADGMCKATACSGNASTTVSGTVYDPAGMVPLYNVTVYVPNGQVREIPDGPSCNCATAISGDPLVTTTTDATGKFTLVNVPSGDNIPLVIQVGKWRREVMLPPVVACQDNPLTDPNLTRLPRNQSEGHIPKIALTTGGADALECLLRKIGIDDAEITPETGSGRVNLFAGGTHNGTAMTLNRQMMTTTAGTNAYDPSLNGGAMFTDAETWWSTGDNLMKYDLVLHSCEGAVNAGNKSTDALQAFQNYVNAGGRAFASHWHNYWIEHGPAPFPAVATFNHQNDPASPFTATIDTTFQKGMDLATWLVNVGASTTSGQLVIQGAKHTVDAVNVGGQRWIYSDAPTVQYFSFNTPLGAPVDAPQCGKVVFSDLHVSSGTGSATDDVSGPTHPFPTGCRTTMLSAQEKALEFMLFDLSACSPAGIP